MRISTLTLTLTCTLIIFTLLTPTLTLTNLDHALTPTLTLQAKSVRESTTVIWPACQGKKENLCVGETFSFWKGESKIKVQLHDLLTPALQKKFNRDEVNLPFQVMFAYVTIQNDQTTCPEWQPSRTATVAEACGHDPTTGGAFTASLLEASFLDPYVHLLLPNYFHLFVPGVVAYILH